MTVANPEGTGSAVAPYDEDWGNLGLEDVNAGDLVMPRINIDHDKAVFINSLTKEEFSALTVVTLGLIKQRIMWPPKLEDDSKPRCKSPDNIHGFPNVSTTDLRRNLFPWEDSNFEPGNARTIEIDPGTNSTHPNGWSSNGHVTLPCDQCTFSKWGTDSDGKGVPPPCSEQHTYPLLYMVQGQEGDVEWIPAIFTVQRSAIKNSRSYINGFAQQRQPFFTQYTGLTLRLDSKGKNEYAVPEFRRMGPTDRNSWGEYGQQLRAVRDYLRAAPRPTVEDVSEPASNENTPPAAPVSAPAPPAPPAAPAATTTPTPEPAPPAPTPPAPAAPQSPPAPPAPTPAAAVPPPPAPPAPPTPPAPPASATPAPAPEPDSSDLPF